MTPTILIVEDDPSTARDLQRFLESDFKCVLAGTGPEAVAIARDQEIAAALVDLDLGEGITGFDVIRKLREIDPRTATIIVTGDTSEEAVHRASSLGADDFLEKASDAATLQRAVRRALILRRVLWRVEIAETGRGKGLDLVAESPAMQRAVQEAERAARHTLPVLITGPVGAGKYVLAQFIHAKSRAERPINIAHCGALATTLVEDELFGHEPGAFTGATARRLGAFEGAEDGTLVLDDVDCLPLDTQRKLLQALDPAQRVIHRLGGSQEIPVRCRVLATSNKDLSQWVVDRQFLPDLLSRLRGAPDIRVPGLEDRKEDIPKLVAMFADAAARTNGWSLPTLTDAISEVFLHAVQEIRWADTRQLRSAVAYAVAMSCGGVLFPEYLPIGLGKEAGTLGHADIADLAKPGTESPEQREKTISDSLLEGSLREAVERFKIMAVRRALDRCGGDAKSAATDLGITPQGLNGILRREGDLR